MDNLTREEAVGRSALISDLVYEIHLDHTLGEELFGCQARITFSCRTPGASTFLDFSGTEVDAIVLNGRDIPTSACSGSRMRLEGLESSNELIVKARCKYSKTGYGMHRFVDPVDGLVYTYTDLEPFQAHRVYPCFDQPDLKGTFTFTVTAPAGWTVVSNTRPAGRPDEGEAGTWRFEQTPVLSTYLTVVVAGQYAGAHDHSGGRDLAIYSRQSLAEFVDAEELFEITRQTLDFYESYFGSPYFLPKYDHAFVPQFVMGAMENPGCITVSEWVLFRQKVTDAEREKRAEYITHEAAHMWFGDLVTMKWWEDLWLNESFATLMAYVALDEATRFSDAFVSFNRTRKALALRADQFPTTHPIAADIPDTTATHVNFDAITYTKGASVLRQLQAWVGEENFREGIRSFLKRHEYGNADLADFLKSLEEASGRDLQSWSKEWIETAGVNTLRPSIEERDAKISSFSVTQEAPQSHPILRSHRLGIGLYDLVDDRLSRRRIVEADIEGRDTQMPELSGEPVPALIVLNDGDLTFAKVRFDQRSFATLTRHLGKLDDPLTRAVCWASAWDMTRDAELGIGEFVDLFIAHGEGEDPGTVQSLILLLMTAIPRFAEPGRARSHLDRLAESCRLRTDTSRPGTDDHLTWARAFFESARSEEHLSILRRILDGHEVIDALDIDVGIRWLIVHTLALTGAAGEDLIAAELDRDPTEEGKQKATTARALIPDADSKEQIWQLINDPEVPFATARAALAGFMFMEQRDVLEPFLDRYFETLLPFWNERPQEVAQEFVRRMYPLPIAGDELISKTDEFLRTSDIPFPVRRIILEEQDEAARALRARSRDGMS